MKNNLKFGRWKTLFWISLAELFALSLWFSASAILPELKVAWNLNSGSTSWVTSSVQIGFIVGALISSFFGISDRFNSRKVFAFSALFGAVINGLLIFVFHAWLGFFIRFLTGMTLAGVYPTAVKLISGRYPNQRGVAIGILIGALTLGSALPHFVVTFFVTVNWKAVIITSSMLALLSSAIMYWIVSDTTVTVKKTMVSIRLIGKVISNKRVMLTNYGYFGHMWELYAMWTWLPAFLAVNLTMHFPEQNLGYSALFSFLIIGVAGAVGSGLAGYFADKIGKPRITIIAMIVSASCSIFIGVTLYFSIWLTLLIAFIWGMSVIADSAQFSAIVTEYSTDEYVGTALTLQMAIGFLITIFSINLLPIVQSHIGWEWVFVFLGLGPIGGVISMLKLRKLEMEKNTSF
jgi:MFS family permease